MSRMCRCVKGRKGQSGRGFTLVELLVVIGIIAVLISILLPSLAKARQAALTVACASNMRQWGLQLQMYADSNGGRTPFWFPRITWYRWNEDSTWWQLIATQMGKDLGWRGQANKANRGEPPYTEATRSLNNGVPDQGALGIFRCPSNSLQRYYGDMHYATENNSGLEESWSYSINGGLDQFYNDFENTTAGYKINGSKALQGQYTSMKLSQMRYPSELIALFEGTVGWTRTSQIDWWDTAGGGGMKSSPAPDPWYNEPVVNNKGVAWVRYAHNLGLNVLYADGHVEWQKGPLKNRGTQTVATLPGGPANNFASLWSNGRAWYARD